MHSRLIVLLNRLHVRHLRLLISIEERGSLNQAAAEIGMTQPGASKSLAEIEDALNQQLFVRTTRGLTPTEAGLTALRYARSITSQLVSLAHELDDVVTGHGGRLKIGAIMGAIPFISEMLLRFLDRNPSVSVEFVEDTSSELLIMLDRGTLDVAIGRTTVTETPERYESRPVRDETLAVVANIRHPATHKKHVKLAELADSRWIVYTANTPMRILLEREFSLAGLPFPRNLIETRSAFATLTLIQQDPAFVSLLSSDVAALSSNFDLSVILPVHLYLKSEPYELITAKGAIISQAARRFLSELGGHQS